MKRLISLILSALLACHAGDTAAAIITDSLITTDSTLAQDTVMLGEITVRAGRFVRTANGTTVFPAKEIIRHSFGGYDLIRNLMIPGVSVNVEKGEVSALGGNVSLYIDGLPSDVREVRQLRPADVDRIQYMDAPAGKYAGDNVALNIILKKRETGGYVALDALRRFGYNAGKYNIASKVYHGNTQYTVCAGSDFLHRNGDKVSRCENICFPSGIIEREYRTGSSRKKQNSQYSQLRVRNKNDRRTLRATFNFVRDAVPEEYNSSTLLYSGMAESPISAVAVRNSSSRNFKYSLGLSGSFNLPGNQFMEASASASASRNHYGYDYSEASGHITSDAKEDYYNLSASCTYVKNFNRGNSLVIKAYELFNVSSSHYYGDHRSWQHLWSSETLCFAQYSHPLWGKAYLRVAPGLSAEFYCLHGMGTVRYVGPRLQTTFVLQPSRNRSFQAVVLYGNSYPQLSMMTGATQRVDIIQQRRGNPSLKVTSLMNATAVYSIGIGKVNLQTSGQYRWAGRLPVSHFYIDKDLLIETYAPNGEWRQADVGASATWIPTDRFNMQFSVGWLFNSYSKDADVKSACWKGAGQAYWYAGDLCFSARIESPQKMAGYNLEVTRTPWHYSLSVSWTKGPFKAEAGADNPFSRHPFYKEFLSTAVYSSERQSLSITDRHSAYIRIAWTVDFGKKIKHDKPAVDRSINSGILKPD